MSEVKALSRPLTSSPHVVLDCFFTFPKIPQSEILHGTPNWGKLSLNDAFFPYSILTKLLAHLLTYLKYDGVCVWLFLLCFFFLFSFSSLTSLYQSQVKHLCCTTIQSKNLPVGLVQSDHGKSFGTWENYKQIFSITICVPPPHLNIGSSGHLALVNVRKKSQRRGIKVGVQVESRHVHYDVGQFGNCQILFAPLICWKCHPLFVPSTKTIRSWIRFFLTSFQTFFGPLHSLNLPSLSLTLSLHCTRHGSMMSTLWTS